MKLKLLSFLLTAALAGTAHAAFYVDEDSPQQTALQVTAARVPLTYGIPFFIKRVQLGPMGRQALQALLTDARTAETVTIVGRGDPSDDPTLGGQRAIAIKQWLVQNGIPANKVALRDDSSFLPGDAPSVFNSEVILGQRTQSNVAASSPDRLRSATLVREIRSPEHAVQPANVAAQQLLNDPAKLAIVSKIITLSQNKLIRPEDVVTLLAELLRNIPAEIQPPQPTNVAYAPPAAPVMPAPPAQIQPTPQPPQQTAVYVTRQFAPLADQPRTWLLDSNKTLRANLEDWALQAGWKKPDWQPVNPYQITFSSTMQGSLLDVLGEIAKAIPELDIQVSRTKREIRIYDGQK